MTALRAMLAIVAIGFAIESTIMALLALWGYSHPSTFLMLLDAAILSLAVAPPAYWLALRLIKREAERRLRAELQAQALGRLAVTDPLTHSMNRRGLEDALHEAMAHAARHGRPLSIVMADVDHFKWINDTYGHDAGDTMLQGIAAILSREMRGPDRVGRYGGEEFLMILPETKLEAAHTVAERIRATLSQAAFVVDRTRVTITISVGVTQFAPRETMAQLLSRVDRAMYQAKVAGRDRVISTASARRGAGAGGVSGLGCMGVTKPKECRSWPQPEGEPNPRRTPPRGGPPWPEPRPTLDRQEWRPEGRP